MKIISRPRFIVASFTSAVLISACSTTPARYAEQENARDELQRASADPLAQEAAGSILEKARTSLQSADEMIKRRGVKEDIAQQSYLAMKYAQIAEAQTRELRARKEVADSESERNRVLLQARSNEAARAQAQANQAQAQVSQTQAQLQDQAAQTRDARAEADRLREQLTAMQAVPTPRGMVLTMGDVLFDTGRATLKPGAALTLDRLSAFMAAHASYQLLIEGHADSQGGADMNLALSASRATSVRDALSSRGVDATRIATKGLGAAFPVASNNTEAGRQQNRRVEILFSDDGKFVSALPGASQ